MSTFHLLHTESDIEIGVTESSSNFSLDILHSKFQFSTDTLDHDTWNHIVLGLVQALAYSYTDAELRALKDDLSKVTG